jgi:hypothetical protein
MDVESWSEVQKLYKETPELLESWKTQIARMSVDLAYCVTKKGRVGICAEAGLPGDKIILAFGGTMPLVVRPDTDGKYTFVSESYIHGFMDGEGLVETRKNTQPAYDVADTAWL